MRVLGLISSTLARVTSCKLYYCVKRYSRVTALLKRGEYGIAWLMRRSFQMAPSAPAPCYHSVEKADFALRNIRVEVEVEAEVPGSELNTTA